MKFLDLFAGIGGFRSGMEKAGHTCVGYVEIDKFARQSYEAMYITKGLFSKNDIRTVRASEVPKADIWCFGFPCTPAGSKIKTPNGYKNIEDIKVGDLVLTHKGRYRQVVKTMNKISDHINKIKATGVYDLQLTDNHPLYVYDKVTKEMKWVQTKDLDKNRHYLTVNVNTENIKTEYSNDNLWLLGRYVADGYVTSDQLTYAIRREKLKTFENHLNNKIYTEYHKDRGATEVLIKDDLLQKIALYFGNGAKNKTIPQKILNAPIGEIKQFLNGYLSGDGYLSSKRTMWTTVSESLALGLQELFIKAYSRIPSVTVRHDTRKETFNDSFNSQLRPTSKTTFVVGKYLVSKISKIDRVTKNIKVYNMEVKDDNSYTIRNIIVHNCQDISVAGKQKGFAGARSSLFFTTTRLIRDLKEEDKPSYLLIENVKNLLSINGGFDFLKFQIELDEIGYDCEWDVLDTAEVLPQHRERVYIVGHFRGRGTRKVFPIKGENTKTTQPKVRQIGNISNSQSFNGNPQVGRVYDIQGISPTLNTMQGRGREPKIAVLVLTPERINKRQNGRRFKENGDPEFTLTAQDRHGVLLSDMRIRKLTPLECWRLQGFTDEQFYRAKNAGVSDSQLYKQAGNSVSVPVVYQIARRMKNE